jgi:DNA-directed RNA polymerase subunit RPC12/RpoP
MEVMSNAESAMLEFTCSTCNKRVQGDDSLAGQYAQCPACGGVTMAPAGSAETPLTPINTAFREGPTPVRGGPLRDELPGRYARWAPRVAALAIVLTLIGLAIPAIRKVRYAAQRTESTQNLKLIGLAFHSFHDANGCLPFNGTKPAVAGDNESGSWAFMILPYLDENPMFLTNDTSRPVATFMCPGRGRPAMCTGAVGPGAWTDYFLNPFLNDPNGVPNAEDFERRLVGITDGTSNTILLGHGQINPNDYGSSDVTAGFTDIIFNGGSAALCRGSQSPVLLGPDSSTPPSRQGAWGGPFSQGALMSMCDATVRMYPYSIFGGEIVNGSSPNAYDFALFLTPCGGEAVTLGD